MSASAVSAAGSSLLQQQQAASSAKITNMEEEREQPTSKEELALDFEIIPAVPKDGDEDGESMVLDKLTESEQQELQEQAALMVDARLGAMAVSTTARPSAQPTKTGSSSTPPPPPPPPTVLRANRDTAPSTATSTGTRSAGESHDDISFKDRLKPFIRTCTKFESGSGSGDQDGMISMEDGVDVAAKKRKTRRGKPKHRKLKPYSKQQGASYQQRLRCRAAGRPTKTGRQPPAPCNTTQFLMEDHNDLPDLDEKIAGAATGSSAVATMAAEVHSHFSKPNAPPRTRDSSFSVDSDEDYFYSSPEDEEEFLTKEFSSAYEDLHAERLGALTKAELIQEYIQLEAKVDLLTKRLRGKTANNQADSADRADGAEPKDTEMAKKLKVYQQRIDELLQQNEQLRRENEMLRKQRHGSVMSSVDSESDSDSSSSNPSNPSNPSNCSCNQKNSPSSSPVPASYHSRREKSSNRRKNSSVSSVDSESDSTTGESSCPEASPKTSTGTTTTTTTNNTDVTNGHATNHKIDSLPT